MERRAVEEERAERFRELYAMLDLKVVCHKDRSLEVSRARNLRSERVCAVSER
jgi:hypothetical protein